MLQRRADISEDPTATTDHHRPDDCFIPIRACDIAAALGSDRERLGPAAAALGHVAEAVADVIEQEALAFERALCDRYAAFNPDRDTEPPGPLDALRTPEGYAALHRRLEYLLENANFVRLDNVQIDAAVAQANSHGLRVRLNPDRVRELHTWVRGRGRIERRRRTWRHPWHGEARQYDVFRRLVVVARLRDDPHVLLKMFKEIPVVDVEALLPHAEVSMSWTDRLLAVGGGAGAVGSTAAKTFQIVTGVLVWSRLAWALLIGGGIIAFRTVLGYRSAQIKRDSQRTRHLYYQNLDNNAGVIHSLISMTAQEEAKEAMLAFAIAHAEGPFESPAEIGPRVEAYLRRRFNVQVRFDLPDGLDALQRLGLRADDRGACVVAPDRAVDILRAHWRARRTVHHHEAACETPDAPPASAATAKQGALTTA